MRQFLFMKRKIKEELFELKLLLKSFPVMAFSLLIIAIFTMNLFANKSIDINSKYVALDCGIIFSWIAFLILDLITKHYGPKGATQLSGLAIIINLFFSFLFFIASIISGTWSSSVDSNYSEIINNSLDKTFRGTWYIVVVSSIAFIVSSVVNNYVNFFVGKLFLKNPDSLKAYYSRSYISTAIAQFVDNFIFAFFVGHFFFNWSIIAVISCSLIGMMIEVLCETIFAFFGYKISLKWKNEGIGLEYLEYRSEKHENSYNRYS